MPDFLNRLAARALGALPMAEPLVPTRFDPGVEHVALSPFESTDRGEGASKAVAESGDRALIYRRRGMPASGGEAFDASAGDRTEQQHVLDFQDAQRQSTNAPHDSWSDTQSAHTLFSGSRLGLGRSEEAVSRDAENVVRARPVFAEPRPALMEHAPEPSRVPGQQQRPVPGLQRAAPIVRVSIGRIEVRAELPPQVQAPTQQRVRPSHVSLEQFLKQASGDRR